MICRGGIVAGGWGDVSADAAAAVRALPSPVDTLPDTRARRMPWLGVCGGLVVVAAVLAALPGRTTIPPLIESDYCYLLTAANRLYDGLGPTATPPVAPLQPWEWRADWAFLTQWPVAYPAVIASMRWVLGCSALDAARWINVAACAAALVGWFLWVRRCVPRGVTGVLLAALAAGCAVSVGSLINPSTDIMVTAAIPWVLMLAAAGVGELQEDTATPNGAGSGAASVARATVFVVLAGLASGGIFWLRYGSVFVSAAIAAYLLLTAARGRGVRFRHALIFAVSAGLPIATLLAVNHTLGVLQPLQAQLNLGHSAGFHLTWHHLSTAWARWADLGFYRHHKAATVAIAAWPALIVVALSVSAAARWTIGSWIRTPSVGLSCATAVAGLALLIGVTAVFGNKYDFVGLDRYYTPLRPFYFVLFAAPVLLIPRRAVRAAVSLAVILACSWTVQQDWARTYDRWRSADRAVTSSGAWARAFGPEAERTYDWLRQHNSNQLVVVSNFHEYIAFETGIAALPIPPDDAALSRWIERIRAARKVDALRVVFVLDRENRERSYWIQPPADIVGAFGLIRPADGAPAGPALVYEYPKPRVGSGA